MPVVHLLCLICVLCVVFVLCFAVPSCIALLYSILLCQLLYILCSIASGCVASCFVVFVSLVFLIVIGSLIWGLSLQVCVSPTSACSGCCWKSFLCAWWIQTSITILLISTTNQVLSLKLSLERNRKC